MPISAKDFEHYRGLIFDMDGTLVDSMPKHLEAWQYALEQQNLPVDLNFVAERGGMPSLDIAIQYQLSFGLKMDVMAVVKAKMARFDALWQEVEVIEATLAVVKYFHGKVPMAIATGASEQNMQRILKNLKLYDYFDALIAAEQVEKHKPHPDTFLSAAEQIGLKPEECLVFEDTPFGLMAADAAAMDCVLVKGAQLAELVTTSKR